MDSDKRDDAALDALFDAARSAPPEPSADLLARLRADADRSLPAPAASPRRGGGTTPLLSGLGAIFAASGLSAAAALGVWIGFAKPDALNLDTFVTTTETSVGLYAFLPGADVTALGE